MIVDDSPVFREIVALMVKSATDIEIVASVGSGFEAVDLLPSTAPDVITLDLGLPDIDGRDLFDLLTAQHRHRLIVLSGRPEDFIQSHGKVVAFTKHKLFEQRHAFVGAIRAAARRGAPELMPSPLPPNRRGSKVSLRAGQASVG